MEAPVRPDDFDVVMDEIREAAEAGCELPEGVLEAAVQVRGRKAARHAKELTLPALGQLELFHDGLHRAEEGRSLFAELGDAEFLRERGFFSLEISSTVWPDRLGEDEMAELWKVGTIVVIGFLPRDLLWRLYYLDVKPADQRGHFTPFSLAAVTFLTASELIRQKPLISWSFLLRLISNGFHEAATSHLLIASRDLKIALGMSAQDGTMDRLLALGERNRLAHRLLEAAGPQLKPPGNGRIHTR